MILVTGATGTVGQALVPRLLERGDEVRVLVRDPRKLGRLRVEVRIALGDLIELGDPRVLRQALRGVDTVIHLAAATRDQPAAKVEELNGLATARLLRAAERSGVRRFVFFSAIGATEFQRTRFFRAKALAERAVLDAELDATVFAPSIVYDREDPWTTTMRRLALLPVVPISGEGESLYEPIWAEDVARCVIADLGADGGHPAARARRPAGAHLRRDRPPDRPRLRPRPAVAARAARARALRARGAAPGGRRRCLRHLGGGRADGGADGLRARHGRRRGARGDPAADGRGPRRLTAQRKRPEPCGPGLSRNVRSNERVTSSRPCRASRPAFRRRPSPAARPRWPPSSGCSCRSRPRSAAPTG